MSKLKIIILIYLLTLFIWIIGGETYVRVEFYDNELCVTNSIYCTKIEQV